MEKTNAPGAKGGAISSVLFRYANNRLVGVSFRPRERILGEYD